MRALLLYYVTTGGHQATGYSGIDNVLRGTSWHEEVLIGQNVLICIAGHKFRSEMPLYYTQEECEGRFRRKIVDWITNQAPFDYIFIGSGADELAILSDLQQYGCTAKNLVCFGRKECSDDEYAHFFVNPHPFYEDTIVRLLEDLSLVKP